ncbi:MAG: DUF3291 domain-containing protein [Paracoccaceae bacterium]
MTDRHLAQINIGRLRAAPDDPTVAEFMGALDRVNGMGKRFPGFVWMSDGSGEPGTGNTENVRDGDPRAITNLTVWESAEALHAFAFRTPHARFFERRAEWFEHDPRPSLAMWWVEAGHRPPVDEALARVAHLRAHGETEHAFGWAHLGYDAPR